MKTKLTLALVAILTGTAFGSMPAVMPEFKNAEQLAEWRAEMADKANAASSTFDVRSSALDVPSAFYTGKPYVDSSGGYAFKYRSYDPGLARWTSEDPSGFPDGANNLIYAANPESEIDFGGFQVKWIGRESSYSPNPTMETMGYTTFSWSISQWGVIQDQGSYTGTFQDVYAHAWTIGFLTWRGLSPSDFGSIHSLDLYGHSIVDGEDRWSPNGFTVSAGFLENANATDTQLANVNTRLNPIGAGTSRNTLRGLSAYLYNSLVFFGAGYNGDLFYE